jgi:hypothetical protein
MYASTQGAGTTGYEPHLNTPALRNVTAYRLLLQKPHEDVRG